MFQSVTFERDETTIRIKTKCLFVKRALKYVILWTKSLKDQIKTTHRYFFVKTKFEPYNPYINVLSKKCITVELVQTDIGVFRHTMTSNKIDGPKVQLTLIVSNSVDSNFRLS